METVYSEDHPIVRRMDEMISLLTQIHERLTWFIIDEDDDEEGEDDGSE